MYQKATLISYKSLLQGQTQLNQFQSVPASTLTTFVLFEQLKFNIIYDFDTICFPFNVYCFYLNQFIFNNFSPFYKYATVTIHINVSDHLSDPGFLFHSLCCKWLSVHVRSGHQEVFRKFKKNKQLIYQNQGNALKKLLLQSPLKFQSSGFGRVAYGSFKLLTLAGIYQ